MIRNHIVIIVLVIVLFIIIIVNKNNENIESFGLNRRNRNVENVLSNYLKPKTKDQIKNQINFQPVFNVLKNEDHRHNVSHHAAGQAMQQLIEVDGTLYLHIPYHDIPYNDLYSLRSNINSQVYENLRNNLIDINPANYNQNSCFNNDINGIRFSNRNNHRETKILQILKVMNKLPEVLAFNTWGAVKSVPRHKLHLLPYLVSPVDYWFVTKSYDMDKDYYSNIPSNPNNSESNENNFYLREGIFIKIFKNYHNYPNIDIYKRIYNRFQQLKNFGNVSTINLNNPYYNEHTYYTCTHTINTPVVSSGRSQSLPPPPQPVDCQIEIGTDINKSFDEINPTIQTTKTCDVTVQSQDGGKSCELVKQENNCGSTNNEVDCDQLKRNFDNKLTIWKRNGSTNIDSNFQRHIDNINTKCSSSSGRRSGNQLAARVERRTPPRGSCQQMHDNPGKYLQKTTIINNGFPITNTQTREDLLSQYGCQKETINNLFSLDDETCYNYYPDNEEADSRKGIYTHYRMKSGLPDIEDIKTQYLTYNRYITNDVQQQYGNVLAQGKSKSFDDVKQQMRNCEIEKSTEPECMNKDNIRAGVNNILSIGNDQVATAYFYDSGFITDCGDDKPEPQAIMYDATDNYKPFGRNYRDLRDKT